MKRLIKALRARTVSPHKVGDVIANLVRNICLFDVDYQTFLMECADDVLIKELCTALYGMPLEEAILQHLAGDLTLIEAPLDWKPEGWMPKAA